MQNFIHLALILFAEITLLNSEDKITPSPFSISTTCRENPNCIFDKKDIVIDLLIKNEISHEIRIPLEFIKQSGPYCILVDNETKKKIALRAGLPDHSEIENYIIIRPRETFQMTRRITAGQINFTRSDMVDLTAKITISGPVQSQPEQEPMRFRNDIEVRIIGRDKIERDRLP